MVFKNLCILVLWTKVALALEGLTFLLTGVCAVFLVRAVMAVVVPVAAPSLGNAALVLALELVGRTGRVS